MNEITSLDFYGLKVTVFDKKQLIDNVINNIENNIKKVYYGYSLATIPYFKKFKNLYKYCNSFDIMVTDGRWFYLLCKLYGLPLKLDISIPNLVNIVLNIANENGYSILLLGSKSDLNQRATQKIKKDYPNIKTYGGIHGYFSKKEELNIVKKINYYSPQILLVGISIPRKEEFIFNYKNQLNCSIIIPCGGMIDVLSGEIKLAPRWIKKIGMAGIIRTIQEPRRLLTLKIWQFYEIMFKIIPILFFNVKILGNDNFFIPRIYKIKK